MAGARSPNYPRLSLREAVDQLRRLWEAKDRCPMDAREAAGALGFSGLNGSAQGVISALRRYGLLRGKKGGLAVSREAIAIVERSPGAPERIAALRAAATGHPLLGELAQSLPDEPDDETLRLALLERGFSRKAAAQAVQTYRATLDFLAVEGALPARAEREPAGPVGAPTTPTSAAPAAELPPTSPAAGPLPSPEPLAAAPRGEASIRLEIQVGTTRLQLSVDGNGSPIAPAVLAQINGLLALAAEP